MKKLVGILILILAVSFSAQAQEKKIKKPGHTSLTPEQAATLQTKKMTLHLDLNDSQQKEINKIFLKDAEGREAMKAKMKERKESGKKMTDDERFEMKNKMMDKLIERKAQMKQILNKDQYGKWEESTHQRSQHMRKRKGDEHRARMEHAKKKNREHYKRKKEEHHKNTEKEEK